MILKTLEDACVRLYKEGDGYAATEERLMHILDECSAAIPELTPEDLGFARKYIRHHHKFDGMFDMSQEIV